MTKAPLKKFTSFILECPTKSDALGTGYKNRPGRGRVQQRGNYQNNKTYTDTYTQITYRGPLTEKIPKRAGLTKKLYPMT